MEINYVEDEWCHKDRQREIRATKMTVIINCVVEDTLTLSLTSVISTARKKRAFVLFDNPYVELKCTKFTFSLPVNEQTPSKLGSP